MYYRQDAWPIVDLWRFWIIQSTTQTSPTCLKLWRTQKIRYLPLIIRVTAIDYDACGDKFLALISSPPKEALRTW